MAKDDVKDWQYWMQFSTKALQATLNYAVAEGNQDDVEFFTEILKHKHKQESENV